MTDNKVQRLKAIKEEFALTQARLVAARRLEESAEAQSMSALLENDLEQAELVLAAQDMMHKLQNMAEDLAKMNAQDLFPLVDKMKATFGQEGAHSFEACAQEAITGAMNTVRHAKDEMGNAIMRLEGKIPANDMAAGANMDTGAAMGDAPAPAAPEAPQGDPVAAAMDDFGGADGASGPDAEPLGRARKESIQGGKALNEAVILEAAGKKLLETEGLDNLISWVLNEAALGMPEEHFRSFATSIAQKAAKDPTRLAGWIGKKKYGMGAVAQLAQPTYTQNDQPDLEVVGVQEGKSFKNSDDDDDNWNKKHSDKSRKAARQNKGDVSEGKSFKNSDDDDDNWNKKHSDKNRKSARKNKGEVSEAAIAAHAIARLIEASIKREGRGNAAQAVKEAVSYLSGKNLVEGDQDVEALVLEAFQAHYGAKPAAYSLSKLKEFQAPMSPQDKKNAGSAMSKVAGKLGGNPAAAKQSVQTAMQGMDGQERNAANKMLNQMKKDGQAPKNAGEFAQKAGSMMDDEDTNESKGENRQHHRRTLRKALNRSNDPSSKVAHGYGGSDKFASTRDERDLDENINAAHWPVDSMGQYKGEPFQTDYNKLKPNPKSAAKTEGGAPETKVEEPKMDGAKSEAPAEPKSDEPKKEKSEGNPFAKKNSEDSDSKE